MRTSFKIVAAIAIVVVTVCGIVIVRQPEAEQLSRGTSPSGYEAYAAALDPEFCRTVALQLSEFGDDPALGFRSSGSPAEAAAAEFLAQTMRDIGLDNVTVDEAEADGWTFGGANITFEDASGAVTVAALGGYQTNILAEAEKLPVAYLGKGTAADYEGIDMTGKLALIDIDPENEWRINYPAYQARLSGARAVVARSLMEEPMDERVSSQDIRGDADAPALAISARDSRAIQDAIESNGYENGGVRQIDVTLNANSKVVPDSLTRNVWGEIPGNTDEAILFIAHYDGYYHSFYDDASGVGVVLGIAKALRESGIRPEKTFRFILHGAGEWGRSGAEADWATGAYEQITSVRPEWAERAFALFSVDGGYPLDVMRGFDVNAPPELGDFVRSSVVSFGDRSEVRITAYISAPSAYREDFIYNARGTPTFAIDGGEGDERFFASMRHSNMDRPEVGGYSPSGALGVSGYVGYTALTLDAAPLRPLKFAARLEAFEDTLEDLDSPLFDAHLRANLNRAIESAQALDRFISEFNADYRSLAAKFADGENSGEGSGAEEYGDDLESMKKLASDVNAGVYAAYREMQDELLRLDRNLEPGFANEGLQHNIIMLHSAKEAIMNRETESAIYDYLSEIESTYAATAFDLDVCNRFFQNLEEDVEGSWAEGRLVSKACRADEIVRSLLKKSGDRTADALYGSTVTGAAVTGAAVTGAAVTDAAVTGAGLSPGDADAAVTGEALVSPAGAREDESGAPDDAGADGYLFADELSMIDDLIKKQEYILKAVYNSQEEALAALTDSMNELLDIYANDERLGGVGA
jgi:hypothetical protein